MTSRLFSKRMLCAMIVAIVALMAAGSVWDWQISCALYDPTSVFGNLLAAYGMHPAMLGAAVVGELLIMGRDRKRRALGVIEVVVGIALLAFGAYKSCTEPLDYLSMPTALAVAVGLALWAAALLVVWRLCRDAAPADLRRAALAIGIGIAFEYVLINAVIKGPWARARFRLAVSDDRVPFMAWWHAGDPLRNELVAAGISAEEFRSFPSGHTGCATALICLGFLPCVSERLRGKEHLLTGIGLAWTALVALSRIIMGAHYLTDVTCGFAIGLIGILLAEWLVYGRRPEGLR